MPQPLSKHSRIRSYGEAVRWSFAGSLLGAASIGIVAILVAMIARGVDGVEVFGVALFLPVLVGILVRGARGGALAAIFATIAYSALRSRDADVLGNARVVRLVASRGVALLAFGLVGGASHRAVRRQLAGGSAVDHDTGLSNAPALVELFDLEVERARRYGRTLAVVQVRVELPRTASRNSLSRRERSLLADLGSELRGAVRTIDRIGIVRRHDAIELVAVLPETGAQGGEKVAHRIATGTATILTGHRLDGSALQWVVYAGPGADSDLAAWRASLLTAS